MEFWTPYGKGKEITLNVSAALGAEIVQPVPVGRIWLIQSVRLVFVTSAVVANRQVGLAWSGNPPLLVDTVRFPSPAIQVANVSCSYMYGQGTPFAGGIAIGEAANRAYCLAPQWFYLDGDLGAQLETQTNGLQATDQYQNGIIYAIEIKK